MPVTINGSGLISGLADIEVPDGTASAPTISNIDDLNTGIFFPAEDTVAISTGSSERMRIDSNGNTFGVAAQNLLYNGAMQVAQRGTSVTGITGSGYNTADRWQTILSTLGTWTQSVENDAPSASGFRKSLKMLCTTADSSPAAGDQLWIRQMLEGQDVQRVLNGTASAQSLTVSFWVKSNVTGTYIVGLWNEDDPNRRIVSAAYTISASATWEKKTVTFAGDTTGSAFDNDNADSLEVHFWLAAGSSYTSGTLATTWANNNNANRAVGQTNLAAATNNYWQVTGVQLEVGPIASPFQFKSFGQELRECQRYYERTIPYGAAVAAGNGGHIGVGGPDSVASTYLWSNWVFKVDKRASPTVTVYDSAGNSGKITTWQSGISTNNVTPGNANWISGPSSHTVLHQGNVAGWQYLAIASAEL